MSPAGQPAGQTVGQTAGQRVGHRLPDGLADLFAAAGAGTGGFADGELLSAVSVLADARRAIDALEAGVLAQLEVRDVTDSEFGVRTFGWVATTTRTPRSVTRRRVRVARGITGVLSPVGDALIAGRIGWEHARVCVDAANPRVVDALVVMLPDIIEQAGVMTFERWAAYVAQLVELLDADGGHDPADDVARNRLHLADTFDGTLAVVGQFCGEWAHQVRELLETETDRLMLRYQADHEVCPELAVPPRATVRAHAFVELLRRARGAPTGTGPTGTGPTGSTPEADVTLVVHQPAVPTEGDGSDHAKPSDRVFTGFGHVCTPGDARLFLCDCVLHRVTVDGSGNPLDVGRGARFATPAQRRAAFVRDGGCVFPGCDAPHRWCDLHHVIHWEDGGPTSLNNLASLCRHHHRVTHRQGWSMVATNPDEGSGTQHGSRFTWTTPGGYTLYSQHHRPT